MAVFPGTDVCNKVVQKVFIYKLYSKEVVSKVK